MMAVLVSGCGWGANVLARDQVRCDATPASSSERTPKSIAIGGSSKEHSLSPPCLTSQTVSRGVRELKSLCNLSLHEDGCALIALVGVFFVNGGVMFLWVVATLHDTRD